MLGDELDARQRALLWEIYHAEQSKSYPPPDRKDAQACKEHNSLVAALIWLQKRGFIDSKDLITQKSHWGGPCRYVFVLVKGLTYKGESIARALDPAPAAAPLADLLCVGGLHQCQRDFERALGNIATDPEQAAGSASSLLESICKAILERAGEPVTDWKIRPLVQQTAHHLDPAAGSAARPGIESAMRQLADLAQSVGTIRNRSGAAHGRSPDHQPLQPRHARLAVNAAATLGLFLLETAASQPKRHTTGGRS